MKMKLKKNPRQAEFERIHFYQTSPTNDAWAFVGIRHTQKMNITFIVNTKDRSRKHILWPAEVA